MENEEFLSAIVHYFKASQDCLKKHLTAIQMETQIIDGSNLHRDQKRSLAYITDHLELICSLYEQQISQAEYFIKEDPELSIINVDELIDKIHSNLAKQGMKKNIHLELEQHSHDKDNRILFPSKLVYDFSSIIIQHIYRKDKDDTVTLHYQIDEINQYQKAIKLCITCKNQFISIAEAKALFDLEKPTDETTDQFIDFRKQLENINASIDVEDNEQDKLCFQIKVPYYDFGIQYPKIDYNLYSKPQLDNKTSDQTSTEKASTESNENIQILLVDDSKFNREIIRQGIQHVLHFKIDEADDGAEALLKIKANNYDIVIADMHMPKISGIELVRQIRLLPEKNTLPVICITADNSQETFQAFKFAGGEKLLIKPIDFLDLIDDIESYTTRDVFFDEAAARKHTNDNPSLRARLQKLFLKEIELVQRALSRSHDLQEVRDTAHKLVSSAAYCGYMQTRKAAALLEKSIDEHQPIPIIQRLINELSKLLDETKEHVLSEAELL